MKKISMDKVKEFFRVFNSEITATQEQNEININNTFAAKMLLGATLLFLAILNSRLDNLPMFYTTFFGGIISMTCAIIGKILKNRAVMSVGICLVLILLFSYWAITGGNDGFAIIWITLIPFTCMFSIGIKYGSFISVYFLIFLAVLFYTPLREIVNGKYSDIFMNRFPFLFFISFAASFIGVYRLHKTNLLREAQNKELEELKIQAEAANRAKTEFLANMSHEIRTPINGVLGMNAIILKECKDPELIEYSRSIQSAGNTLLALVNDVLDISKIETGKMELYPEKYELCSILNDCYNMINGRAVEKGLDFYFSVKENVPSVLYGDEVRVRQVIVNLLTNAVKYTEKGSVTLSIGVTDVSRKANRVNLVISVKDTGTGIKEVDRPRLFKAFTRLNERNNRMIEGTGLGLNIISKLATMMDGKIEVYSVYGEGSEFIATIPQTVINWEPVGNFDERYRRYVNERTNARIYLKAPLASILVVDDVEMNLKVITGLLKDTDMDVDTAESGFECIEKMQRKKYDVVFIDHMMPGMDGVETFKKISEMEMPLNENVPVIMLTANAVSGVKEEYLEEGFSDYLSKPVMEYDLKEVLIKHLPAEKIEEDSIGLKDEANITENTESVLDDTELKYEKVLEKLCRIPGISVDTGLQYAMNDPEFYIGLVNEYISKDRHQSLNDALNREDYDSYRVQAHSIKSTSKTIGIEEFSDLAKDMEFAIKEGRLDFVKENHNKFIEEYSRLLGNIREAIL